MYVLTSPDISPSLIADNVIDRTIELVRFQLNHSIYPEFDPVYRSSLKIKRSVKTTGGSKYDCKISPEDLTGSEASVCQIHFRVCSHIWSLAMIRVIQETEKSVLIPIMVIKIEKKIRKIARKKF